VSEVDREQGEIEPNGQRDDQEHDDRDHHTERFTQNGHIPELSTRRPESAAACSEAAAV